MSARPRRAKSAGPAALPPPSTAATPRARKAPRASLAVVSGSSPRISANLPQTPVGVSSRAFRKSLLDGSYRGRSKGLSLEEREQLVRRPAEVALEGLCAVGKGEDDEEDDFGALRLSEENTRQYSAFDSLKKAYFSESTFLSAAALSSTYPDALADPFSPLSSLIKLSNLTTFLYLVLSSAPTPDGTRPRTALKSLREAIGAFLSYVVPVDSQIHDGALRMLVGLNCQAYLSASAHSRTGPPPISDFFSAPLSSYLTLSNSNATRDPLQNREAAIRFNKYNADAIALVEKVGADLAVLETQWRFEDVALELRNYCESVARRIEGEQSASQELLAARISESEPEIAAVEQQQRSSRSAKGKQKAVSEDEDTSEEEEGGVVSAAATFRAAHQPGEVEYDDQGDLEVDEARETDSDGEESPTGLLEFGDGEHEAEEDKYDEEVAQENDDESDQRISGDPDTTVDESAEDEAVALALGALSPRAIQAAIAADQSESSPLRRSAARSQPETQNVEFSTQLRAQIEAFRALQEESDSQSQSQDSQSDDVQEGDATIRVVDFVEEANEEADEAESELPATVNTQLVNRASEFGNLYGESEDEDEDQDISTQAETQLARPNAAAEFRAIMEDLSDAEEEEERQSSFEADGVDAFDAASVLAEADVNEAPQTRLAFLSGSNTLARVPIVARTGPSMFDRQPDAERILFDSQGDSPVPTPKAKKKGKGRSASSRPQPATSPLPSRPAKSSASGSKPQSKFLSVEIPIRTRRATRSASAETRSTSPVPIAVSRKGGARQSSPLEVPIQVGRGVGSSSKRGRSKSFLSEQRSDQEEDQLVKDEDEHLGFGKFETETFEMRDEYDHGGGGHGEKDLQYASELQNDERLAEEDFALQMNEEDGIVVPRRLSREAKGKGKAKQTQSPLPAPGDEEVEEDDDLNDSFVAQAMNFFGTALPSASNDRPSVSAAPRPQSRSPPPPAAGPSRSRPSSSAKSTSKKRQQPQSEGPAFQIDDDSEDEELVTANRKRRRREPQQEYEEEVFDPVSRPRQGTKGGAGADDIDMSTSAGRRKAQKAKMRNEVDRDDDWEEDRLRRKRSKMDKHPSKESRNRLPSLTPSDSDLDSDISIQSFGNHRVARNVYAQGRKHSGRVAWTDMEEQALMKAMSEMPCQWRRIIDLYGPEGTSSRIFENRTVVSLKDKAVNIKAGLIRAGRAVPYFLSKLTVSEKKIGKRRVPARQLSSGDEQ